VSSAGDPPPYIETDEIQRIPADGRFNEGGVDFQGFDSGGVDVGGFDSGRVDVGGFDSGEAEGEVPALDPLLVIAWLEERTDPFLSLHESEERYDRATLWIDVYIERST
jgi:hypothetical protein